MSNNNVPTGPGLNYRQADNDDGYDVVRVHENADGLYFWPAGESMRIHWVKDDSDWLGPVPMPGEWVPRSEYDEVVRNLDDRI